MTLRIFGKTADKFPVLLAGLIMKITINVALHHKRDEIIWMPWISPPISLIKMRHDDY
jgi:D-hexose-6-phosphate mutarotase